MSNRRLATPGLSYVDANAGRVVTFTDDVLGIKAEILGRWPEITDVLFDTDINKWLIIQTERDGTQSLLFETEYLDGRVIERIERADRSSGRNEDILDEVDKHNDELERDRERRFEDKINDAGERLMFALIQDGLVHRPKAFFSSDHAVDST